MFRNTKFGIFVLFIALGCAFFVVDADKSKGELRSSTVSPATLMTEMTEMTEMTDMTDMTKMTELTEMTDMTKMTELTEMTDMTETTDIDTEDDNDNAVTEVATVKSVTNHSDDVSKGNCEDCSSQKPCSLRSTKRESGINMKWDNKSGVNENIKNSKKDSSKLYNFIHNPVTRWTSTFANKRFDSKQVNFFLLEGGRNGYGFYGILNMQDLILSGALDEGSKLYLNFDRIGGRMSLPVRVDILNVTEDFTVSNSTINSSMIAQTYKAILPRWTGYSSQIDITKVLDIFSVNGKFFDLHILISTPSLSRFGEFSTFNRTDSTGFSMIALGNLTIYDKYIKGKNSKFSWWYIALGLVAVLVIGGVIYFCCGA